MVGECFGNLPELRVAGGEGGLVRGEDQIEEGEDGDAQAVGKAVDSRNQHLRVVRQAPIKKITC